MTGKVIFVHRYTRKDAQDNAKTAVYLFGDNMLSIGYGGQAGEMRDEPNAIGVPTKYAPGNDPYDFFSETTLEKNPHVASAIIIAFSKAVEALDAGKNVVIPSDGLGTGLSRLPEKAPNILLLINRLIEELVQMGEKG